MPVYPSHEGINNGSTRLIIFTTTEGSVRRPDKLNDNLIVNPHQHALNLQMTLIENAEKER